MSDQKKRDAGEGIELEEIFGAQPDIPFREAEREFRPWHRPRKQYVRREQWLKEVEALYEESDIEGPFRYFSLPGEDFLDVRHLLSTFCVSREMPIRFLGFNDELTPGSDAEAAVDAGMFGVRHQEWVDPLSAVKGLKLQDVARESSLASNSLVDIGPFHAINLDLCDSVTHSFQRSHPNMFTVLLAFLVLQAKTPDPSLLLLTTRIDRQSSDEEAIADLKRVVEENLGSCEEFAQELEHYWPEFDLSRPRSSLEALGFEDGVLLGFVKWLVREAARHKLRCSVRSVVTYKVDPAAGEDDIASIAFRLEPSFVITGDDSQLAQVAESEKDIECERSKRIPRVVSRRKSADGELAGNSVLRKICLSETEVLLAEAGWDIAGYKSWLDEGDG